jgi:hypothetical protein
MVRGMNGEKPKKRHTGLMQDKDYVTEAMLQGGKAYGEIIKGLRKKSSQKKKK